MFVYKATNRINGKAYIGISTVSLRSRQYDHKQAAKSGSSATFHKAIRKYGFDAFEWSVIQTCSTEHELWEAEAAQIAAHRTFIRDGGYNRTRGGAGSSGAVVNGATRAKMSAAQRGRRHSPETIAKIKAALTGRKRTPEQVARIAAAAVRNRRPPAAHFVTHWKGRRFSAEHREKIREAAIARWARQRAAA